MCVNFLKFNFLHHIQEFNCLHHIQIGAKRLTCGKLDLSECCDFTEPTFTNYTAMFRHDYLNGLALRRIFVSKENKFSIIVYKQNKQILYLQLGCLLNRIVACATQQASISS